MPNGAGCQRSDIVIWVGETGYRLPIVSFNELDGVWQVQVQAADPLIAALSGAGQFVLAAGPGTAWSFGTTGLASALQQTLSHCEAAWSGQRQRPAGTSPLMATAQADILRVCEGSYTAEPGAFLQGQIDQDAMDDLVVWWNNISCNSAFSRPLCGASHCSAKVFLSTQARPLDLLAQGVTLQPLTNGKIGLNLVGRFDSCGPDSLGCERLWFWNGSQLVEAQ